MHPHISQVETVSVPQLQVGDVVGCHGGVFRITSRREVDRNDENGATVACQTECLDYRGCNIPKHWVERPGGWIIQGNRLATIGRFTDADLLKRYSATSANTTEFAAGLSKFLGIAM